MKIFIDSDLFVRDLRYKKDSHAALNDRFLRKVRLRELRGVTSIFNVLEICGVLSFNFNLQELRDLYGGFTEKYQVQILFPSDSEGRFDYDLVAIYDQIQRKQGLGDAEISSVIRRFSNQLSCFVSWNARHFDGKIPIPAKTPEEF